MKNVPLSIKNDTSVVKRSSSSAVYWITGKNGWSRRLRKTFSGGLIYEHGDQWLIKQRDWAAWTREERWKSKEKLQEWGVVMGNVVFCNYNIVYIGRIGIENNIKPADISSDGLQEMLLYKLLIVSESSKIAASLMYEPTLCD